MSEQIICSQCFLVMRLLQIGDGMKLIVSFKEEKDILEFVKFVGEYKLNVKNLKNLEYIITPTIPILDQLSLISMIRNHPSVHNVVEVPKFTGFNASDF